MYNTWKQWTAFLREVGDGTVYKGEELQANIDHTMQNVIRNKQAILDAVVSHLERGFSSFNNDTVFKIVSVLYFKKWPLWLEGLKAYGNQKLLSLVDHFEGLLIRIGCDIDSVPLEWVELDMYFSGLVASKPAVSSLNQG